MTGYLVPTKKVRVADFARKKADGEKWAMLTAYDYATARVFAEAGIECLLVGDSAANVVYGYDTTNQVSVDEMAFLGAAVVRGALCLLLSEGTADRAALVVPPAGSARPATAAHNAR